MMRHVRLAPALLSLAFACGDEATVFDRAPRLELTCSVSQPVTFPSTLDGRWWFTDVATTEAGSWGVCDVWSAEGNGALFPLDRHGGRGEPVVLDPNGLPTRTRSIAPSGRRLSVLFDVVVGGIERRFVVLDEAGALTHPSVVVPDGRLVALSDGTFALVSVEPTANPDHPDLVVRVLDDAGTIVGGPETVASLALPPGAEAHPFNLDRVVVASAPDGFAVVWIDAGEDRHLLVAEPDGDIVLGPKRPGGETVLALPGATWVAWATTAPDTVHVAVYDDEGGRTQSTVAVADDFAGSPRLFAVDGTAVLAWSQGPNRPEVCGGCFDTHALHLAALTCDGSGHIVPASNHVVIATQSGALSLDGVARFGDDLLLAMTSTGHALWEAAVAAVTCAPLED